MRRSLAALVMSLAVCIAVPGDRAIATAHPAPTVSSEAPSLASSVAVDTDVAPRPRRAWPGGRVTYVDRTRYPKAVRLAVRAWNSSGVGFRFVKAKRARNAQLVIGHERGMPCAFGVATVGYTPRAYAYVGGQDQDGDPCAWPEVALKTAHELGHVLGLDHIRESTCATMNPTTTNGVAPTGCLAPDDEAKPGRWWCRMVARPDIRGAKRLYGGRVRERSPEWCDAYPMIPQTGPVTATSTGVGNEVRLSVTRAPEPVVPDWVRNGDYATEPGVEVHVTNDGCVSSPEGAGTYLTTASWDTVAVGGSLELAAFAPDLVFAGRTCVTVWQYDAGANYSDLPTSAVVQQGPLAD